jgi:gluconate 5-dehydrogenase
MGGEHEKAVIRFHDNRIKKDHWRGARQAAEDTGNARPAAMGRRLDWHEETRMTNALERFRLDGRRALITGSGRGIGLTLARGLAEAGAAIVINDRNEENAATLVQHLREEGFTADYAVFDVAEHAQVRAAIDDFEARVGAIDILVNNAGIQRRAPLDAFEPDDWHALMRVNLDGVFNVAQAVARHMIARGRGKIINICSVQSELARPTIAPYAATKGAVRMLTKGMCADWARHGTQPRAGRRRGVLGLAVQAYAGRPLGARRRAVRRGDLPRVGCIRFRERPDAVRRRRADECRLTRRLSCVCVACVS